MPRYRRPSHHADALVQGMDYQYDPTEPVRTVATTCPFIDEHDRDVILITHTSGPDRLVAASDIVYIIEAE